MARNRKIEVSPLDRTPEQHKIMLARDIAPPSFTGSGERRRWTRSLPLRKRPGALLGIAVTAFLIVLGVWLIRNGALAILFPPRGAKVEQGSHKWMLGDRLPPPPLDKSATTDPYAPPSADPDDSAGTTGNAS